MNEVDEYLSKVEPKYREALERVRAVVRAAVPDAIDVISYGMPGFKYRGKYLAGYAAFKKHLSFFPTSAPVEQMADLLTEFKISRGTVQFTLQHPLPEELIGALVEIRRADIDT